MVIWSAGSSSTNKSFCINSVPREKGRAPLPAPPGEARGGPGPGRGPRLPRGKAGAGAGLARALDLPPVLFHDLFDDREADSGPRLARFLRLFGAVELAEDLFHFLVVHADALVANGDPEMASRARPG